jgi:hypothetical protein
VEDADDLEQPEKELAMASLWPVPDPLGGCSDVADAAVDGGTGLGAMSTSGGAVGKDGDTRRDRAHTQRLPAVPSQVPAQLVVEAAKERRGMDRNRLAGEVVGVGIGVLTLVVGGAWAAGLSSTTLPPSQDELREGNDLSSRRLRLTSAAPE